MPSTHPIFGAIGNLGCAAHLPSPGSRAPCGRRHMCERVKCGSLQAAELDRRALHELGESVLSALSQPSATLLCSSLGFPAGRSQYGLGRVGAGTAFGLRQAERPPTPSLGLHLLPYIWGGWKPHKIEQVLRKGSRALWRKGPPRRPGKG